MELKISNEVKQEYVKWLQGIVERLKPFAVWYSPSLGVTFRKIGNNKIKL
jgi:hypothetical protein